MAKSPSITALVGNSQASQSSSKFILQSSLNRGNKFQILERLLGFQDTEGLSRNGMFHHDHVSDAEDSLSFVKPTYQHIDQMEIGHKSHGQISRQAWNTAWMSVFELLVVTNE